MGEPSGNGPGSSWHLVNFVTRPDSRPARAGLRLPADWEGGISSRTSVFRLLSKNKGRAVDEPCRLIGGNRLFGGYSGAGHKFSAAHSK